ncbi:MAG: recombination-associated protein RdgC [Kiritimatiellae bacterium]|nr:recombination-associated protein RdgC [Kiritimatiellia bacterium]
MGFDSGNVSFRLFHLRQGFTRDAVERFAALAAPPIETLGRDPIQGWVSGRHLLDRDISEANSVFGAWMHLCLMRAERKIPEALLRAYCRIEEETERLARGTDMLPRQARAEIKTRVVEQLLPTMPPTLTGLPMALSFRDDLLLAGAMSDQQLDRFCPFFRETTGVMPLLLTAETIALLRRQVNATDLLPSSFTPDQSVESDIEISLGLEFLTWMWFFWEREGGTFHLPDGGEPYGFMFEGPVMFFREGQGAHEAVLRKGSPLLSREAGIALYCGKKLKRAKFTLARGSRQWVATVDADFGIRALKLPQTEQPDPAGRFEERMLAIEEFWRAYMTLYDRFLDLRRQPAVWQQQVDGMRAWVAQRAGA